jgi:hypothetical protein
MSIGVLGGIAGSAAGVPSSQAAGGEAERVQKDGLARERQVETSKRAESAGGIGQTERDQASSERDADGRRLWEGRSDAGPEETTAEAAIIPPRQSKDASGQCGNQLDLTG